MCVICDLTTQGYESAYLAVETDASEHDCSSSK